MKNFSYNPIQLFTKFRAALTIIVEAMTKNRVRKMADIRKSGPKKRHRAKPDIFCHLLKFDREVCFCRRRGYCPDPPRSSFSYTSIYFYETTSLKCHIYQYLLSNFHTPHLLLFPMAQEMAQVGPFLP